MAEYFQGMPEDDEELDIWTQREAWGELEVPEWVDETDEAGWNHESDEDNIIDN